MYALKTIASGSLLILFLYSCHQAGGNEAGTDLSAIKWETIDQNKAYTDSSVVSILTEKGLGSSFSADLHLTFPVLSPKDSGKDAVSDSVSLWLQKRLLIEDSLISVSPKETMKSFIDKRLEEFKADFEAAKKEGYSGELLAGFVNTIEMTDSVFYNDNNLFSILTTTEEYTGGALGLQTSEALTIDFSKQALLTPGLLFKEESLGQVNDLILKGLMKQNNVTTGEELEELGFFNFEEAKVTDNMLLTEDAVSFIYNPYEIAAYFVGTVQVSLAYSDISPFLSEEYAFLAK